LKGHVKPNKDKYLKSVQLKLLQVSSFTICLLITCILAEETDFEIGHFCTFQTSVTLTLIGSYTYRRVALINLYLHGESVALLVVCRTNNQPTIGIGCGFEAY